MPNGGKRPGAGRKPGFKAKIAEAYNELLAKEVEKQKLPIIQALIKKAVVHADVQAIKEIHERLMGKVAQPLANDGDSALLVQWLSPSNTNQETGHKSSTPRVSAG